VTKGRFIMNGRTDVAVVGGGIAGASLAFALAREGLAVTVLESTLEFSDRVRGESMQVWGVQEARTLGVEAVLRGAGAHTATVWKQYAEGGDELTPLPMDKMIPGVEGSLNLRHPDACQALLDASARAGATVVRGVSGVSLKSGASPTVGFAVDGRREELHPSLVVGADGRKSTIRKQAGIALERQEATTYIAGLLLDRLEGVPDDFDVVAAEGDCYFLLFHQGGGRARAYVCGGTSGLQRFAGPEGTKRFLEACAIGCYPWSDEVAGATPAGPCATYPGDDTWTATPFADRIVLVGDAAGHNDPIVGQGLSIALRDARIVRDLVLNGARDAAAFTSYGAERMQRMERLRLVADVIAAAQAEDADNREARRAFVNGRLSSLDPEFFPLVIGVFTGPDTIPDELVDRGWVDRIRAACPAHYQ
jgi:2-polyprenyl-6-methoxyphenol hydroxylase-like FAD-dependent oxidoreductase